MAACGRASPMEPPCHHTHRPTFTSEVFLYSSPMAEFWAMELALQAEQGWRCDGRWQLQWIKKACSWRAHSPSMD